MNAFGTEPDDASVTEPRLDVECEQRGCRYVAGDGDTLCPAHAAFRRAWEVNDDLPDHKRYPIARRAEREADRLCRFLETPDAEPTRLDMNFDDLEPKTQPNAAVVTEGARS